MIHLQYSYDDQYQQYGYMKVPVYLNFSLGVFTFRFTHSFHLDSFITTAQIYLIYNKNKRIHFASLSNIVKECWR